MLKVFSRNFFWLLMNESILHLLLMLLRPRLVSPRRSNMGIPILEQNPPGCCGGFRFLRRASCC